MKIGIIGVGVVGGALSQWLKVNTSHEVAEWDPYKGKTDDLHRTDAIFICIPVKPGPEGQYQEELGSSVEFAKGYCKNVFIRSTVLPGTNDRLGTIACPEFLTARIAHDEMERLPILVGNCLEAFIKEIFPNKKITMVKNKEAELAKFAHNCFGAVKVTFFNMIYKLSQDMNINYEDVMKGVFLSGFVNEMHTKVPGPDGLCGYSGFCYPENMDAFTRWLSWLGKDAVLYSEFFDIIQAHNLIFRPDAGK